MHWNVFRMSSKYPSILLFYALETGVGNHALFSVEEGRALQLLHCLYSLGLGDVKMRRGMFTAKATWENWNHGPLEMPISLGIKIHAMDARLCTDTGGWDVIRLTTVQSGTYPQFSTFHLKFSLTNVSAQKLTQPVYLTGHLHLEEGF